MRSDGWWADPMWHNIEHWNTTAKERRMALPCDAYLSAPYRRVHRAITVQAPVPLVFRWLCQLRIAPYSYDWIDNAGRRSPRTLTPGADKLSVGQNFLIGAIAEFDKNRHVTARNGAPVAVDSMAARIRAPLLVMGDLVMMRKQLHNLKRLAERSQESPEQSGYL